jgi:hypothetical protein
LVVDADVARSAGDEGAADAVAVRSRNLLQAIGLICHHLTLTTAVWDEWQRHTSRFTRRWLRSWSNTKVVVVRAARNEELRHSIERALVDAKRSEAWRVVETDMHLIEAAMSADYVVVSRDDRTRRHLLVVAGDVPELAALAWVSLMDAFDSDDALTVWLNEGAPTRAEFLLTPP